MSIKTLGTHDGSFHCDEVLALVMLRQLPECKGAKLVRTRKSELLKQCDIVFDVGAEYDPEKHLYDHHQP